MNPDPYYSAAYVLIATDASDGLEGHGFAFTIGRGNDAQAAAIQLLESYVVGRGPDDTLDDLGSVWKTMVHDSQLRWLGGGQPLPNAPLSSPTPPGASTG